MEYIHLGKTDLRPSKIGFGCSAIASVSTSYPPSEVIRTLETAYQAGINFFDTADIYGQGDSERMLGQIFSSRRDKLILCTKGGLTLGVSQRLIRWVKPLANPLLRRLSRVRRGSLAVRQQVESSCFEPRYLISCIEGSLRRLRTEYIDLYLLHGIPAAEIDDHPSFALLDECKRKGKIRYWGISISSIDDALFCINNIPIDCIEVPANVMHVDLLNKVLPVAKAKGIGIITREPLGNGAVFSFPPVQLLCSGSQGLTPAEVALRYLFAREDTGVVLTGMTCGKHLRGNLAALAAGPLSRHDMTRLQQACAKELEGTK